MTNLILDNISLILLLPLWIFLIIMCGRFFSVYVHKNIIYFLTLLSSFLGVGTCGLALINIEAPIEWIYPFIKINQFSISFGLQIDKLSLIIAFTLFIISFAIQLFSINYMKEEKKNYKFFALLNLFNFAMAFLLFSPNLFQFYVFWELVGIVSYLLIGFDYKDLTKSNASKRVFLINRVGDTALISGVILTSYYMFEYVQNTSFITLSFQDLNAISTLLLAYASTPIFLLICGLFIIAAIVKSAQFPFYTWLQDAMEAKLPVSALLHSATMVAAGVYLIIRMMPFFTLYPKVLDFLIFIGYVTVFICSLRAIYETHPKKLLAYSTSANLGFMFMALGCQNIKAGVIFLIAHAFTKSALFLLLPTDNKKWSYIQFALFIIFALSLSGIIFAGHSAKEFLAFQCFYNAKLYCGVLFLFPAIYMTKLTVLLYKNSEIQKKWNSLCFISILVIFICNILLYAKLRHSYSNTHLYYLYLFGILGGFGTLNLSAKHPNLLEKINNEIIPAIYEKLSKICLYFENKVFTSYKPLVLISKTGVNIINWIEVNVFNKTISHISNISKGLSKQDIILQSGNVQTYNAYAFIIVTVITALVIVGYTIILN